MNNNYANKINQSSKFSDYSIESQLLVNEFSLKIDARLGEKFIKKEMNYEINFNKFVNTSLIYNETQSEAYSNLSNDTQSIVLGVSKKVNDNININIDTNLDVKNNYDPYKSIFKLSLFDECSQLDISYSNTRFNDNFNTQPEEKISFTFNMDYLGFLDTNNQQIYFLKSRQYELWFISY